MLAEAVGKSITPGSFVEAAYCALSVYVGVCLWRVTATALGWLKVYFITAGSLLALVLLSDIVARSVPREGGPIGLMLWTVVWYLYFHKSKRVRLTYGRNL